MLPLGWFSGHFHLGQDYQDSITFPNDAKGKRGSCVFAQTAVMAKKSSRDTRQQSRLLRGTKTGFTIRYSLTYLLTHSLTHLFIFFSTVDHAKGGVERLDATITYDDESHESIVFAHESEDYDHDAWFSAYTPQEEDGCYIGDSDALKTGTDAGKVLTHSLTYSLTHSLTH